MLPRSGATSIPSLRPAATRLPPLTTLRSRWRLRPTASVSGSGCPRAYPPHAVARAWGPAWPGSQCRLGLARSSVLAGPSVMCGELRLVAPSWLPLGTDHESDPLAHRARCLVRRRCDRRGRRAGGSRSGWDVGGPIARTSRSIPLHGQTHCVGSSAARVLADHAADLADAGTHALGRHTPCRQQGERPPDFPGRHPLRLLVRINCAPHPPPVALPLPRPHGRLRRSTWLQSPRSTTPDRVPAPSSNGGRGLVTRYLGCPNFRRSPTFRPTRLSPGHTPSVANGRSPFRAALRPHRLTGL